MAINKRKLLSKMALVGLSQRALAKKLKVNKDTLNAKINGRTKIDTDMAEEICSILNIEDGAEKAEIFLPSVSLFRDESAFKDHE